MKFLPSLFVAMLAVAAHAAENPFIPLLGNYAGTATVETASTATGAVTLGITTPAKKPGRALIEITGSVSPTNTVPGTGNATPVKARLQLQRRRVQADNFLLGLSAGRNRSSSAQLRGSGETYRFTLASAAGEGRLRCTLKLRKGVLTLTGTGFYAPDGTARQPVKIVISATKS